MSAFSTFWSPVKYFCRGWFPRGRIAVLQICWEEGGFRNGPYSLVFPSTTTWCTSRHELCKVLMISDVRYSCDYNVAASLCKHTNVRWSTGSQGSGQLIYISNFLLFSFVLIYPASYCTCTPIIMLKEKHVNDFVRVRSTMSISKDSHHIDFWSKHSP